MERVLELIREQDLRDALVRLWVLASRHNGDDRVLNAWERNKDESRYQRLAKQFRKLLRQGKPIGPIHAEQEPLALITALDGFLAEEQRISRRSVKSRIKSMAASIGSSATRWRVAAAPQWLCKPIIRAHGLAATA